MVRCHGKPGLCTHCAYFEMAARTDVRRIMDGFVVGYLRSGEIDRLQMLAFLDVLVSDQAARLKECYRACLLYGVSVDRKAPCGGTLKGDALNGV